MEPRQARTYSGVVWINEPGFLAALGAAWMGTAMESEGKWEPACGKLQCVPSPLRLPPIPASSEA